MTEAKPFSGKLVYWKSGTPLSFTNSLTLIMFWSLLIARDFVMSGVLYLGVRTAIIPIPWKVPCPSSIATLWSTLSATH